MQKYNKYVCGHFKHCHHSCSSREQYTFCKLYNTTKTMSEKTLKRSAHMQGIVELGDHSLWVFY